MKRTRQGWNAQTILAAVCIAALFAAIATQICTIVAPVANALPLLALFFAVGMCCTWIMARLEARWQRAAGDRQAEDVVAE